VIEATTGVPLATLPRRVPRAYRGTTQRPGTTEPAGAPALPGGGEPPLRPSRPALDDPWLPIEEVNWDGTPVEQAPAPWFRWRSPLVTRPSSPPKPPPPPAVGLTGLVLLALLAGFFAWVGAEPLWLALGHGHHGVATVAECSGSGLDRHCRGDFTADGAFAVLDVRLADVAAEHRAGGTELTARMVGPTARQAYVGAGTGLLHLRWLLSLAMVLGCGAGVTWVTGARRIPDRRSRRRATLACFAGPLALAAGLVVVAF
jgi:hypothetical protein